MDLSRPVFDVLCDHYCGLYSRDHNVFYFQENEVALMSSVHERLSNFETLYENESERMRHLSVIQAVAKHIGAPLDEVERLHGIVLKRYKTSAIIKDFLPILVSRRVEYLLDLRRKNNPHRMHQDTVGR